jgi:hypothetical protein
MTQHEELIATLRKFARTPGNYNYGPEDAAMSEAAYAIETQAAEIARLTKLVCFPAQENRAHSEYPACQMRDIPQIGQQQ